MLDSISDKEALAFFKKEWVANGNVMADTAENLLVLDRLENDRAILFYMLDRRYWDDFRILRFNGSPATIGGRFILHYYDKAQRSFIQLDGDIPYFSTQEIWGFFYPERSDTDVLPKLKRFGDVRHELLEQIIREEPINSRNILVVAFYDGIRANPYRDPTRVPTKNDFSKYFVRLSEFETLDDEKEENLLVLLEKRLTELGIIHWREGHKVAIERAYPRSSPY